jgi:hypothetical protein
MSPKDRDNMKKVIDLDAIYVSVGNLAESIAPRKKLTNIEICHQHHQKRKSKSQEVYFASTHLYKIPQLPFYVPFVGYIFNICFISPFLFAHMMYISN